MKPRSKLFVSFWHISLENLPAGTFVHRQISAAVARRLITKARGSDSLLCVSHDDLLSPYHSHDRDNHTDLCRVLTKEYRIEMSLRDFCGKIEDDEGSLHIVNPLNLVQVEAGNRLLIVTCMYQFDKRTRKSPLGMKVAPTTVRFHLIEADEGRGARS